MKWFGRLLINAMVIFVLARVTEGWLVRVDGIRGALLAAFVLGLVNALVRPFVLLVSIPVNIITLGLFTFVVNALMLLFVSVLLSPSFQVMGFWRALLASLIISIVSSVLSKTLVEEK